jgi:hypothetical protein
MEPIEVELPDGTILEVPAGSTPEFIKAQVQRFMSGGAPTATTEPARKDGFLEKTGDYLGELTGGALRGTASFADLALSPVIAAERQIRPYAQAMLGQREMPDSPQAAYRQTRPFSFEEQIPERGAFAGDSRMTDVVAGTGEVLSTAVPIAQGMRFAQQAIPKAIPTGRQVIETTKRIGRELLETTPKQEAGFGAAAVAGGEIAQEIGGEDADIVGQILAPLTATGIKSGAVRLFDKLFTNPRSVEQLALSLNSIQNEAAADLLSEALTREGMTVDEAISKLDQLGPNAIPADIAQSFRRLLRAAGNMNPNLQGRTARDLAARNVGQAERVAADVDLGLESPDMTVDQAIAGLREATAPAIEQMYAEAGATPFSFSGRLKALMEGDNSLGEARQAAERRLSDRRALGDEITHFDVINETKQVLDDQIGVALRQGENNKARQLTRLKNEMIKEADAQIPRYAEARATFAGERALESAAEQGELFLKANRRQVIDTVENMTPAEMQMYRLGARQAIMDKIDVTTISADLMKRMFGRNGDVVKLRAVFPDEQQFQNFMRAMKREAEFILTRRTALENSTTVQQAQDIGSFRQALGRITALFGNPVQASSELANIFDGLGQQKNSRAFAEALQSAGDILLTSGMNPRKVREILEKGNTRRLRQELQDNLMLNPSRATRLGSQVTRSATMAQLTGEE